VTRDGLLIPRDQVPQDPPVPLHDTAAAGCGLFGARRPRSNDDPVFIGKHARALRYIAVKETFDRLVRNAGIARTRGAARACTICDTRSRWRALQVSPDEAKWRHIWRRFRLHGPRQHLRDLLVPGGDPPINARVAAAGEDYLFDGRPIMTPIASPYRSVPPRERSLASGCQPAHAGLLRASFQLLSRSPPND